MSDAAWGYTELAPEEEERFQKDFRNSDFFREFVGRHKEEPDLAGDYDYRGWWRDDALRATRHQDGTLHGPSKTSQGKWLKAPTHPTAWKQLYMEQTGRDPDALGISKEQADLELGLGGYLDE